MTDNPSSSAPSKGPTRGEEIVRASEQGLCEGMGYDDPERARLVALIDSALASQEARHQQEMEKKQRELDHWKDCHGFTADKLLAAEQELAEAKRDAEYWRESAPNRDAEYWRDVAQGLGIACFEAVSKLREAEARERGWTDFLRQAVARCRCVRSSCTDCELATIALRRYDRHALRSGPQGEPG